MSRPVVKRPRILLADAHALVLDGLRKILEPEFSVVGMVRDGRELLARAKENKPDVILLDISLPLVNGIEAARALKRFVPNAKVILVTMPAALGYVTDAFHVGVSGYISKGCTGTELVTAIRQVLEGQPYVSPLVTEELLKELIKTPPENKETETPLTRRQKEVLRLSASGHSAKQISQLLGISARTVEYHKYCIMKEFKIHTTAELTRYAIKFGLIDL